MSAGRSTLLSAILWLGVLLAAGPVRAQEPAAPDGAGGDFRQRLLLALDLTATQRHALRLRRDRLQAALEDLRHQVDGGRLLPEEGRRAYRELLEAYRDGRDSLLTPAQGQLLARARVHQRQLALTDGRRRDSTPRLVDALRLSESQQRSWQALLARQRDQVRQLEVTGQVLTAQDLRLLREEHRLAFEALLTATQRLELQGFRQAWARRQAAVESDLEAGLDLLDEAPVESFPDDWRAVDSTLGEDGTEP